MGLGSHTVVAFLLGRVLEYSGEGENIWTGRGIVELL